MEGATDLSDLLGGGGGSPVQNPSFPQSTTFAPMVTGGGDPFIAPVNTKPAMTLQSNSHMFSTVKYAMKNLMTYFGFFLAAILISLSTPRSLILQYIPNTYTSGGVPSYMGAAILAGVAVVVAYIVGTLGSSLF
jgi:hypothetical protein